MTTIKLVGEGEVIARHRIFINDVERYHSHRRPTEPIMVYEGESIAPKIQIAHRFFTLGILNPGFTIRRLNHPPLDFKLRGYRCKVGQDLSQVFRHKFPYNSKRSVQKNGVNIASWDTQHGYYQIECNSDADVEILISFCLIFAEYFIWPGKTPIVLKPAILKE